MEEYLEQAEQDRQDMVDNLETQGISGLSGNETFTQLVPQILNIQSGGDYVEQYSTMPTATAEDVGKIVQFTGTTDSTYTNGYFYVCVESSGSYSWSRKNVQPTTLPSEYQTKLSGAKVSLPLSSSYYYSDSYGAGLFAFTTEQNDFRYARNSSQLSKRTESNFKPIFLYQKKATSSTYYTAPSSYENIGFVVGVLTSGQLKVLGLKIDQSHGLNYDNEISSLPIYFINTSSQTFSGVKTFNSFPITPSSAPTTDYQTANKKYVDDKPTTYTGYDATKTQVLKNINGTLTWVDET